MCSYLQENNDKNNFGHILALVKLQPLIITTLFTNSTWFNKSQKDLLLEVKGIRETLEITESVYLEFGCSTLTSFKGPYHGHFPDLIHSFWLSTSNTSNNKQGLVG